MSADKFEEWLKGYYVDKGFISSEPEMKAAWLASSKAALEEAAKEVERMGEKWRESDESAGYAVAIRALKE